MLVAFLVITFIGFLVFSKLGHAIIGYFLGGLLVIAAVIYLLSL